MDLVLFEDKSQGEVRPYVPSAVFYSPEGDPPRFGFDALYSAPDGTKNLKTGFKADLIDPPVREKMQFAYRVDTTKGSEILTPENVLDDFICFVMRTTLSQIEAKVNTLVKRVGVVIGVPAIEDKSRRESYREKVKSAVKKALDEIGKEQLAERNELLLYEPLAVYKYYQETKSIPGLGRELNVLVVRLGRWDDEPLCHQDHKEG
jgi:molecular chaperone DnaK (HSP70)